MMTLEKIGGNQNRRRVRTEDGQACGCWSFQAWSHGHPLHFPVHCRARHVEPPAQAASH